VADDATLSLSNLTPDRERIPMAWRKPDGEVIETEVELAVREDFGPLDHGELEHTRMRYELLKVKGDNATPAERGSAEDLLNKLAKRLIIGAPEGSIEDMHASHKDAVVQRFFARSDSALLKTLQGLDEKTLTELSRLGSSLHDSSGSTAATQSSGDE